MNRVNRIRKYIILLACFLLIAVASHAKQHWKLVSRLQAGGGAKEVPFSMTISQIRILCVKNSVILNTVVVREETKKDARQVVRTLGKGEEIVLDLDRPTQVTGLRISDGLEGEYEVYVKKAKDTAMSKIVNEDKWQLVSEVYTGKGVTEIEVGRRISSVKICCIKGFVVINTVVVREGDKKMAIPVTTRFEKNQEHIINLNDVRNVTSLRISDDGRGEYAVYIR
ncbi:MAG: hypothetical protein JXN60_00770 [Lentisphaerae bacterium]|nr:hypothetical protein [Lentisphaerota bacterium]